MVEPVETRAQVIVIAGPSGSGKSQLCHRLGLPYVNLDDFYKDGDDPTLPLLPTGRVDWDHPGSWLHDDAVRCVETLCREGEADVPVYDLSRDGRFGRRRLSLGDKRCFVAEGIFAQEIVAECADRGLLADAICLHNHRAVTFWRRLRRDLREHRKPPMLLLRRGLALMRAEPEIVAHAAALGCTPVTPHQARERIRRLIVSVRPAQPD